MLRTYFPHFFVRYLLLYFCVCIILVCVCVCVFFVRFNSLSFCCNNIILCSEF